MGKRLYLFILSHIDLLILIILSLTPLLWYKPGTLVFGHDTGYPLDTFSYFNNRFSTWIERQGFGTDLSYGIGGIMTHILPTLIQAIGTSLYTAQKLSFVLWFFLMEFSAYYFVKVMFVNPSQFFSLFAGIFYAFNFYILQGWVTAERTKFSLYIALPIIIAFVIRSIREEITFVKAAIFISLTLFFLNGAGGIAYPLYAGLIVCAFTALVFFSLVEKKKKGLIVYLKAFKFIILTIIVFIFLNAYWFLPFLEYLQRNYSSTLVTIGGAGSIKRWTDIVSQNTSYINLIKLNSIQWFYGNNLIDQIRPYAQEFLGNPILILASFIWPIAVIGSFFISKRNKKEEELILYLAICLILGIFFSAGTHAPLGGVYFFLMQHIPGFVTIRSPYYKFASAIYFAYAIIIGYVLNFIIIKIRQNNKESFKGILPFLIGTVSVLFLLLYHYPFFSSKFFVYSKPLSTMLKVPEYILQFGNWADNIEADNQRFLVFPPLEENFLADVYDWNYWSLQIAPSQATQKSLIANDTSSQGDKGILINAYYDSIRKKSDDWRKLNYLLGVKYFLLRNDVFYKNGTYKIQKPGIFEKLFEESADVKFKIQFDKWKIYSVDNSYFTPHFYISNNLYYLNGDTNDFVNNLSLFPVENQIAYYFAGVNASSFTPQVDFDSFIVMPGNPCCFAFNKNSKSSSSEYKSLIDAEGTKTVFFDKNFSWQIPKEGKYKIFVKRGRPFTNGENIAISVDSEQLEKRMKDDDRKTDWIDLGEMDLSSGVHSLEISVDGSPIRVLRAGDIIFANTAVTSRPVPEIIFQKINNTKYKIHVSNVTSPYNLIFNESFDGNWKLYLDKNQKKQDNTIIASYFDGKIQENNHTNSFLNKNIFETLFLKNLPETRHIMVNGYANAWWIKPEDTDDKTEYDLIVEYFPQRLFYIGTIITIITFISCLGCLIILRRKVKVLSIST